MFGFGKKRNKVEVKKEETVQLSEEQKSEILNKINADKEKLEKLNGAERIALLDEVGLMYADIGEIEEAIVPLEESLSIKKATGKGYRTLLSLYNKKRAEAARNNDDPTLQYYLEKIDHLMQISKDVARGIQ